LHFGLRNFNPAITHTRSALYRIMYDNTILNHARRLLLD